MLKVSKSKLNELFDSIGVRIMGTFYYGTRQLTTNKPIETPDDLKGLNIRTQENKYHQLQP